MHGWVACHQEQVPVKGHRRVICVSLSPTHDLAVVIACPWVRAAHRLVVLLTTVLVIGQGAADGLSVRVNSDPFRPVHSCRTHNSGRFPGEDHHFSLAVKTVLFGQAVLAVGKFKPLTGTFYFAVPGIEAGNIKGTLFQQVSVRSLIGWLVAVFRHEFVDVLATFIITQVNHYLAVIGDSYRCIFVFETTQGGAFKWGRGWIHRIDLYYPAMAVRFVWLFVNIKAVVESVPLVLAVIFDTVAFLVSILLSTWLGKVTIEVLFTGQVGAPGGFTVSTVIKCTQYFPAGSVCRGFHQVMASSRACDRHLGIGGDTTVIAGILQVFPAISGTLDFENRYTVGCLGFFNIISGHRFTLVGKQQLIVGVLIVYSKQGTIFRKREEAHTIGIVTELTRLGAAWLQAIFIKCWRAIKDRVTPGDQWPGNVPFWNNKGICCTDRDFGEAQ